MTVELEHRLLEHKLALATLRSIMVKSPPPPSTTKAKSDNTASELWLQLKKILQRYGYTKTPNMWYHLWYALLNTPYDIGWSGICQKLVDPDTACHWNYKCMANNTCPLHLPSVSECVRYGTYRNHPFMFLLTIHDWCLPMPIPLMLPWLDNGTQNIWKNQNELSSHYQSRTHFIQYDSSTMLRHGFSIEWYKSNRQIKCCFFYDQGKRIGLGQRWYSNGWYDTYTWYDGTSTKTYLFKEGEDQPIEEESSINSLRFTLMKQDGTNIFYRWRVEFRPVIHSVAVQKLTYFASSRIQKAECFLTTATGVLLPDKKHGRQMEWNVMGELVNSENYLAGVKL